MKQILDVLNREFVLGNRTSATYFSFKRVRFQRVSFNLKSTCSPSCYLSFLICILPVWILKDIQAKMNSIAKTQTCSQLSICFLHLCLREINKSGKTWRLCTYILLKVKTVAWIWIFKYWILMQNLLMPATSVALIKDFETSFSKTK